MIRLGWRRAVALPGVELVDALFARELPHPTVLDGYLVARYVEGAAELWRPGGVEPLAAGALLVAVPGQVVRVVRRLSPRARLRSLLISSATMARACDELGCPLPSPRRSLVADDALLATRVEALLAALDDGDDALAAQSTFVALVAALVDAPVESAAATVDESLDRARSLLHDSVERPPSLDELAAAASLSKFHLVRRFNAAFGLPPHRYQLHLRLERARTLLAAGQRVGDVANALGFADQSHLTRRFSRAFGVSPARYGAGQLAG